MDEIHIWQAKLPLASYFMQQGITWLSQEEQERACRFKIQSDSYTYIASHALLRRILAAYLNIGPSAVWYTSNVYGKPYLDVGGGVFFNMSHSGDRVLYAVAESCEVGIDVEKVTDNGKWEGLADHICSPQEEALLKDMPEDQSKQMLYSIWTLKEAYLKARGTGLAGLNQNLSVLGETPTTSGYTLKQLKLGSDYYGAVAAACPSPVFRYFQITSV